MQKKNCRPAFGRGRMAVRSFWIVLLIAASSCSDLIHDPIDSKIIRFEVGFPSTNRTNGVLYDKETGKNVVYFANAGTFKEIKFYHSDGSWIRTIELDSMLLGLDGIARIDVWSTDSILLMEQHTNRVVLVTQSGKARTVLDVGKKLNRMSPDRYELWPSPLSPVRGRNRLIFNLCWLEDVNMILSTEDPIRFFQSYCELMMTKPLLLSMDIGGGGEYVFGLDSFYHKISEEVRLFDETAPYAVVNGKVFTRSFYSDRMFVLDPERMEVIDTVLLHSDITTTHMLPLEVNSSVVRNDSDMRGERLRRGSGVQGLKYSRVVDRYFVVIAHSVSEADTVTGGLRSFSVLEYDGSFQLIAEHGFPSGKYVMHQLLSLDDGLYVLLWYGREAARKGEMNYERILRYDN